MNQAKWQILFKVVTFKFVGQSDLTISGAGGRILLMFEPFLSEIFAPLLRGTWLQFKKMVLVGSGCGGVKHICY